MTTWPTRPTTHNYAVCDVCINSALCTITHVRFFPLARTATTIGTTDKALPEETSALRPVQISSNLLLPIFIYNTLFCPKAGVIIAHTTSNCLAWIRKSTLISSNNNTGISSSNQLWSLGLQNSLISSHLS
jgi:hypothetical protein